MCQCVIWTPESSSDTCTFIIHVNVWFTVYSVMHQHWLRVPVHLVLFVLSVPCSQMCTRYVLQIRKRNLSCFIIINPVYDWSCLQVQCWSRHMQDRHHSHVLLAPLPPDHCLHHCVLKPSMPQTQLLEVKCLVRATNYLFLSCALNLSSSLVLSFKTYTHNQQTEENKAIHQFLSSFNFRSYDRTWWLFPPP